MPAKPLKILLIEDNEAEVVQVRESIHNHNPDHIVNVLNDGVGVIQFLEENSRSAKNFFPNLIMLDLNLPKLNGRELISELKNHPDLKTVPVIVLTSSDLKEDIRNSYRHKISSYIVKPAGNEELERAIHTALDFYSITQMPTNNQIQ
jgi:CheY-like chemotaxis protein